MVVVVVPHVHQNLLLRAVGKEKEATLGDTDQVPINHIGWSPRLFPTSSQKPRTRGARCNIYTMEVGTHAHINIMH